MQQTHREKKKKTLSKAWGEEKNQETKNPVCSQNDLRLGNLKTDKMVNWPNCYVECPDAAVNLLSQSISSHTTKQEESPQGLEGQAFVSG